MSKSIKKIVSLVLSICLVVSIVVVAGCTGTNQDPKATAKPGTTAKSYTYKGYATALGTNWNPHSWEADADDDINGYITMPFCTMSIKDSENGIYQWIWEMATGIKDVTKEQKADLTKYGVTLPEGKTADEVEDGYVFEIALNPNAKWENGEKITADDYIYSMEQLLNSKMRNYRSNLYWGGESAVAGGLAYYNSEAPIYGAVVPSYDEGETGDYSFDIDNNDVYISLDSGEMTIAGYSFYDITAYNSKLTGAELDALNETANPYGYIKVTDENKAKILEIMDKYLAPFNLSIYTDAESKEVDKELYMEFLFKYEKLGDKVEYDKVGCYKVDDYTIRYVCQYHIDYNYFLTSCTSTWLVYKDLYESGKDTTRRAHYDKLRHVEGDHDVLRSL